MKAMKYTERDKQDARRILDSFQYSSPERVAWAVGVEPEYATRVTGQKVVAFGELPLDDVPRAVTAGLPARIEAGEEP